MMQEKVKRKNRALKNSGENPVQNADGGSNGAYGGNTDAQGV